MTTPILGAGGTQLFELQGVKPGQSVFRLAYARAWEYNGDWESFNGTRYSYNVNF